MFGYATDETEECMPLTVVLAHQLNKKIADLRRDGTLWWARPDSKTQVTRQIDLKIHIIFYFDIQVKKKSIVLIYFLCLIKYIK